MIKRAVTLTLNEGHLWLIMRGLAMLTSEAGELALLKDYPDADTAAMAEDIQMLCNQLEEELKKS